MAAPSTSCSTRCSAWVAAAASRVLAPRGRLVNLGGSAADAATFSSAVLRSRSLDVLGYTNNSLTPDQRPRP